MTVKITIIGLGQIGASIGLSLAGKSEQLVRVGHDLEREIARRAEKLGAIDKAEFNLHSAVEKADLILLCIPMDQIRETILLIAQDLKDGAVVMDMGPAKEAAARWAAELLPDGRHHVGLTPVINPAHLQINEAGIEAARADLFQKGIIAITCTANTDSDAIKLAADLAQMLGAAPFFADLLEVDGLIASSYLLPQLLAAALVGATINEPGWRESRKLAGREYTRVSEPLSFLMNAKSIGSAVLNNRQNAIRVIDGAISALEEIREGFDQLDEKSLGDRFYRLQKARELWWGERQTGEWSDGLPTFEIPENPGVMGRLFGTIGMKPKPKS